MNGLHEEPHEELQFAALIQGQTRSGQAWRELIRSGMMVETAGRLDAREPK